MEELQQSYEQLSSEVDQLLARNALAEDVAAQLSKFNAEIVGHKNPAQRIMYVERIRNELAESRHALVLLQHEHNTVVQSKEAAQREVDMYKSINAPRGTVTRVLRGT